MVERKVCSNRGRIEAALLEAEEIDFEGLFFLQSTSYSAKFVKVVDFARFPCFLASFA